MREYDIYISELLRWNKTHKLISTSDEAKILERHIKDSEEAFYKIKDFNIKEIADIGSGAGFPGVVIAILDKNLRVSLIESVAKKCSFLEYLKIKLGLSYEVICKDANNINKSFEATIERALGKPKDIVNIMEKLSNKYVFLMVGENEDIEYFKNLGYNNIKLNKGFLLLKNKV